MNGRSGPKNTKTLGDPPIAHATSAVPMPSANTTKLVRIWNPKANNPAPRAASQAALA